MSTTVLTLAVFCLLALPACQIKQGHPLSMRELSTIALPTLHRQDGLEVLVEQALLPRDALTQAQAVFVGTVTNLSETDMLQCHLILEVTQMQGNQPYGIEVHRYEPLARGQVWRFEASRFPRDRTFVTMNQMEGSIVYPIALRVRGVYGVPVGTQIPLEISKP